MRDKRVEKTTDVTTRAFFQLILFSLFSIFYFLKHNLNEKHIFYTRHAVNLELLQQS